MKKLLLYLISAAVLMPVLTASADYIGCDGEYYYGEPQFGECWRMDDPQNYNPDHDNGNTVNDLEASGNSGRTMDDTDNSSDPWDNEVNDLESSGSASDWREQSNKDDLAPETEEGDVYKETHVENLRDYCTSDTCWVIYDECYDSQHCLPKKESYPRSEYDPNYDKEGNNYSRNRGNTWNYWINYYLNNYYITNNYYGMPACNSRYQKCVYRGYHFGGYHNGYWPSNY